MIDRQHGCLVFECDSCPEVLETGERDFQVAWGGAKEVGWRVTQTVKGGWEHSCPNCS